MKIIKIIGLFCLFTLTFFYTEKAINVSIEQDEIMIKIKEYQSTNINPTNAIINNNTIIPGNIGKHLDINTSYKKMKKLGHFDSSLLTYENIYPEISIYNNYNKYIVKGNTQNKSISLIYILNNNTIDNIISISKKYNIKLNIFIDSGVLNNNISIIDTIKENEIYNYGSNGSYTKDNLIISNNIINNKSNNKSIYCLFKEENELSLNNCSSYKMLSILIKNKNFYNIKNNLNNGSIFLIDNTQELPKIIEYIISKGYNIVPLSELIIE